MLPCIIFLFRLMPLGNLHTSLTLQCTLSKEAPWGKLKVVENKTVMYEKLVCEQRLLHILEPLEILHWFRGDTNCA